MNDARHPRIDVMDGRRFLIVRTFEGFIARMAVADISIVNGMPIGGASPGPKCSIIGKHGSIAAGHTDEDVWAALLTDNRTLNEAHPPPPPPPRPPTEPYEETARQRRDRGA